MHISHGWIALFACLVAAGCGSQGREKSQSVYASCTAPVTRDTENVLFICGQLNESNVQLALDQIRPSDREVLLTSGGGFPSSAIKLAEVVRDNNITIRVRGFCLSACSTYVLLTAPRALVEPNAIVAFHHTGAFAYETIAARTNTPKSHPNWAQAREEREFFLASDLPVDLLDRLALTVEPTCMGIRANQTGKEMFVAYRWAWFVPDLDTVQSMFGGRLSGYWPKSGTEARALLGRLQNEPTQTVRYGGLSVAVDPASVAATLPECRFT